MKHRVCLPKTGHGQPPAPGDRIELDEDRAHYLHRVLRLRRNAELGLFDGQGSEWRARLSASEPRRCELEVLALTRSEPRPTPLILAMSWLKGGAMDRVIQKSVELGATAIWLLDAERSNLKLDERRMANKLTHLNRIAIGAVEQCESAWLPSLEAHTSLASLLERRSAGRVIMLDLGQPPLRVAGEPEPLLLLVGPEGGWSEAERALAVKTDDLCVMGLGELTLRAETAPVAALAAIRHAWGWQR